MTGGRLRRLKKLFLDKETFLMTYGDGLSDINLKKLVSFHQRNKSIMTLTAVRPPARFGSIKIKIILYIILRKNPLLTKDGSTWFFVF